MFKKVLIVDDSTLSRLMIKEIIVSVYSDWECIQAASADKAIAACKDHQFDFITLDLNMPGRSGFDAVPEIKASQKNAKVALLTANIQSIVKQQATDLGLLFIPKPIHEKDILDFIGR